MRFNVNAAEFRPCFDREHERDDLSYIHSDGGEDSIEFLRTWFPMYSTGALRTLLHEECGGSVELAMQTILDVESEIDGQTYLHETGQGLQPELEKQTTSYDISTNPDNHASGRTRAHEQSSDQGNVGISDEREFPSLGGTSQSIQLQPSSAPFGGDFASKVKAPPKLDHICKARATHGHSSVQSHQGWTERGRDPAPIWKSQEHLTRFDTGDRVAAQYSEQRSDARDHARLRNQAFQAATQAYLAGNKALAKELGNKGRWHNEMMKKAHAEAAQYIFSSRNSNMEGSDVPIIDLHGLHVDEAKSLLLKTLDDLQSRHVSKVHVVVGIGQHGKVPSRLPTAMKLFLKQSGFRFKENYSGVLEVLL